MVNDCTRARVATFLGTMKLKDGTPVIPVASMVDYLLEKGFFTAPASSRFHLAEPGGLFEHSRNVTATLLDLTEREGLVWQKERSPYIVGMFHDLCKADQYIYNESDGTYTYNKEALLKGHGEKSVILLSKFFTLTEEEIACIVYHMGAFTDRDQWGDYTRAIHKFPNVLWTHQADMIATHIVER